MTASARFGSAPPPPLLTLCFDATWFAGEVWGMGR